MDLIARLQVDIAPEIFKPRAVYDGRKNLFAPRELPLGDSGTKEVRRTICHISLPDLSPLAVHLPSLQ